MGGPEDGFWPNEDSGVLAGVDRSTAGLPDPVTSQPAPDQDDQLHRIKQRLALAKIRQWLQPGEVFWMMDCQKLLDLLAEARVERDKHIERARVEIGRRVLAEARVHVPLTVDPDDLPIE